MSNRPAAPPPPGPAAPPPPNATAGGDGRSPKSVIPAAVPLNISSGIVTGAEAIVIYGPEGIGKSTAASWLPSPFFLDINNGTRKLDVSRDTEIPSWPVLRGKVAAIAANPPSGIETLVIDTGTDAQRLAVDQVVATRKTGGGKGEGPARHVSSIEEFGWGRGWNYAYDEFDALVSDLDRVRQRGIRVCVICHAVPSVSPNPGGDDFLRYDMHLYAGDKNGRGSIRNRIKAWADDVLFIGYDIYARDGKGVGDGSRTIYSFEQATHYAKSRSVQNFTLKYEVNDPSAIWRALGILPSIAG